MIDISKIVKEHIPLCIYTLGLNLGYLGYHAVRWIIDKCQRIDKVDQEINKFNQEVKKIDQLAQKNVSNLSSQQSSSHSTESLINKVSNLAIPSDKVIMGQGEYIVFHKLPTGEKHPLSPETFELVYEVLLRYSPAVLVNENSEKAIGEFTNRYELIKSKLKEIDQTLECIFIPRTLYELIFIRKCIQEDLKHNGICLELFHRSETMPLLKEKFKCNFDEFEAYLDSEKLKRKCWHLRGFVDMEGNEDAGVKSVAYRLNNLIFKAFNPSSEGFTHQEFAAFAEKEIEFLKDHHKNLEKVKEISSEVEGVSIDAFCNVHSPTINFASELIRGEAKPMGIRDGTDAQIIREAIALECSQIAQHSLFLYRGANFKEDSTFCWSDPDKPYSLSYGSSLFAGCVHDGEATAFFYMRNQRNNAYAIPVSFDQLNDSPFFVPTTHSVVQLFGKGEIFHARTKAWKDFDVKKIGGRIIGTNGHKRDHLKSNLSKEELNTQFKTCKNKAIQLK